MIQRRNVSIGKDGMENSAPNNNSNAIDNKNGVKTKHTPEEAIAALARQNEFDAYFNSRAKFPGAEHENQTQETNNFFNRKLSIKHFIEYLQKIGCYLIVEKARQGKQSSIDEPR